MKRRKRRSHQNHCQLNNQGTPPFKVVGVAGLLVFQIRQGQNETNNHRNCVGALHFWSDCMFWSGRVHGHVEINRAEVGILTGSPEEPNRGL